MVDNELPSRLYKTDRYPDGRLNIYSKPEILNKVWQIMKDTPEWERLRDSSFGDLFRLPVKQCSISGKMIHGLLGRQLITKKKYELTTVFAGQPLRFSLVEFGMITGLNCCEFPEEEDTEDRSMVVVRSTTQWEDLFGQMSKTMKKGDQGVKISDILEMLEDTDMDGTKRLKLALICIVDGVLICNNQVAKATPEIVEMLSDVDNFLSYPWGRVSFLKTINSMKPGQRTGGEDPVKTFRTQLQQQTKVVYGFPLAFQLLVFRCIPRFLERMPNHESTMSFMDTSFERIPKNNWISSETVIEVEFGSEVKVVPYLKPMGPLGEGWGEWIDEIKDKKLVYLENLVDSDHNFMKEEWPGGDSSQKLIKYVRKAIVENKHYKKSHIDSILL